MKTALSIAGRRFLRRRRYSGRHQNDDDERCLCHDRDHRAHGTEHDRCEGNSGGNAAFLKEQLDAVFEDIFPDAVKIGMVSSSDLIRVIAERLRTTGQRTSWSTP